MSEREREMPVFETKTRIDWQEYWRMYLRLLRKSWIIWVVLLLTAGCVAIAVVAKYSEKPTSGGAQSIALRHGICSPTARGRLFSCCAMSSAASIPRSVT